MKQTLLKSLLLLCSLIAGSVAWADTKELTFDVSTNPGDWPTVNSTTLTDYTYTLNEVDYTFALKNIKCNSGYLMMYQPAALGLPAIEGYRLTKVEATNSGGCSTSTKVGVSSSSSSDSYISGGSQQTWSKTSTTYTYSLTSTTANTVYYLYITNKNAQITSLKLTYASGDETPTCDAPTFSPAAGTFTSAQEVAISTTTEGATIFYTLDESVPTTESTQYTSAITVSETTTIKAIAVKDGYDNSSVASATYKIVNINHAGILEDPYTVADAINAIDLNTGVTSVYAKGIVSKIVTAYNSKYGNITYNISADGTTEGLQLQAYRGKGKNGDWFTSEYDIQVGDEVVIYGNLKKYNTTYEFDTDNQLVSLIRKPYNVTIGEAGYATMYLPSAVKYVGAVVPEAKGVWTFDDPANLLTGTGVATLQATTHKKNEVTVTDLATAEITAVEGPAKGNGAVKVPVGSSLMMLANTGATEIGTYTVMWDVCADDCSTYIPLLQNSLTDGKDGSFYINKYAVGHGGDVGYNGSIKNGEWNRIVFVVEPYGASVYLNGIFLASKYGLTGANQAYNMHWLLKEGGALFFADEDGEENVVKASEIRFWDQALNAAEIAELGSCVGTTEVVTIPEAKGVWTFDDANNLTAGTGVSTLTATSGVIVNGDGSVTVPVGDELEMTTNLNQLELNTYTLMMDVKFPDVNGYTSLFQNKLANDGDASLFIKNGQIGVNYQGVGYNGSIAADTWYRIMFVVDDLFASIYVNGEKISQSTKQGAEHWKLSTGALFFRDDDVDEKVVTTTEIRFWDEALSAAQIALLSTVGTEIKNDDEQLAGSPKVYTAQITGKYLTLDEVSGTIPAQTAVILKGAPGTYAYAIAEGVEPIKDNDLQGTLEPIDAVGKYVLAKPEGQKVGFYLANEGKIAAGKAYLELPVTEVKAFYFDADDATSINSLTPTLSEGDGAIYNIAGQRINKLQKGINIVNGKKILK